VELQPVWGASDEQIRVEAPLLQGGGLSLIFQAGLGEQVNLYSHHAHILELPGESYRFRQRIHSQ